MFEQHKEDQGSWNMRNKRRMARDKGDEVGWARSPETCRP